MKRGVPPTDRNARTGELTPPGVTARARSKRAALAVSCIRSSPCVWSWRWSAGAHPGSQVLAGLQAPCDVDRPVGEHDLRAGPADRGERLNDGPVTIDPAVRGG